MRPTRAETAQRRHLILGLLTTDPDKWWDTKEILHRLFVDPPISRHDTTLSPEARDYYRKTYHNVLSDLKAMTKKGKLERSKPRGSWRLAHNTDKGDACTSSR